MEKEMQIKVFGPGCAKCTEAEQLVKEVVAAKGGDITVEKVSDLKEMMMLGIMSTPALAIDGVVKCTGRIPTKEEISAWIAGADSGAPAASTPTGCCCGGKC